MTADPANGTKTLVARSVAGENGTACALVDDAPATASAIPTERHKACVDTTVKPPGTTNGRGADTV